MASKWQSQAAAPRFDAAVTALMAAVGVAFAATLLGLVLGGPFAAGADRSGPEPNWAHVQQLVACRPFVLSLVLATAPAVAAVDIASAGTAAGSRASRHSGASAAAAHALVSFVGRYVGGVVVGVAVFQALFTTFGAPLQPSGSSLTFSALMASATVLPAALRFGTSSSDLMRLCVAFSPETAVERAMVWLGVSTTVGATAGCFVLPLDWDRAWQSWPVPCVVGASALALVGAGAFALTELRRQRGLRRLAHTSLLPQHSE